MDNTLSQQSLEQLESVFQDVISSLCLDSIFNGARTKHLFERLRTYLQEGHELVSVLAEDDTKNNLMWVVRRWAVKDVGTDFATKNELEFTREIIDKDANNFHAWSHRRWAIKDVGNDFDAKNELEFTRKIIDKDANNSHAWSHRRWVFQTFGGDWEDDNELEYCAEILKQDTYNFFGWDQRYFVVQRFVRKIEESYKNVDDYEDDDSIQVKELLELQEVFEGKKSKEVDYAIEVIAREPENHYPWSHIGGLYVTPPFEDRRIINAILGVLKNEKDSVHGLEESRGVMGASYLNPRAMVNALNMLVDLHIHGLGNVILEEPGKDLRGVINGLCPGLWPPEGFGFIDNFCSLLERMDMQRSLASSWRDIVDEGIPWGFDDLNGASRERGYKQIEAAVAKFQENINEGLKFYVTLQGEARI